MVAPKSKEEVKATNRLIGVISTSTGLYDDDDQLHDEPNYKH